MTDNRISTGSLPPAPQSKITPNVHDARPLNRAERATLEQRFAQFLSSSQEKTDSWLKETQPQLHALLTSATRDRG